MDRRITIALVVVLALLGVYIWFNFFRADAPPATAVTPEPTPILFLRVREPEIASLQVRQVATNQTTRVVREGDGWRMEQPAQGEAYFVPVERLAFDLSRVEVDRKLENPGPLADYGLEPPQYEVVVTMADDSSFAVLIGNETTDGNYSYAQKSGDSAVYLVDFSLREEIMGFISAPPYTPTPSPTPEPPGTPQPTATP